MESYGEHVYGKDRKDEMMSRLERIERSKTYSNRYAEVLRKAARK